MSKIDLSKAKIGDKFRDRQGSLYELIYALKGNHIFRYLLVNEQKDDFYYYHVDGSFFKYKVSNLDLVEQVFDEPLDTKERDIRTNYEMGKAVEVADEEKQELQRRQEVVELARKMLFDDNTYQFYTQFYVRAKQNEGAEQVMTYLQYVMDYAEDCVNKFNQYLKEGKL